MENIRDFTFSSSDGHSSVHVRLWEPETPPRAVVQLGRPDRFALEGDSSEDLFDALNGLLEAMETATGIRGIEANDTDDAPVYNLGGQRVSNNAKGIVIKNGKKIIRK